MISDPIGDMVTRIRNAILVSKKMVTVTQSTINQNIADVLKQKGYIEDYKVEDRNLHLYLRYEQNKSVILGIKRLSKPGLRRYVKAKDIPSVFQGLGMVILSTPNGVLAGFEAKKQKIGGELLCQVW